MKINSDDLLNFNVHTERNIKTTCCLRRDYSNVPLFLFKFQKNVTVAPEHTGDGWRN